MPALAGSINDVEVGLLWAKPKHGPTKTPSIGHAQRLRLVITTLRVFHDGGSTCAARHQKQGSSPDGEGLFLFNVLGSIPSLLDALRLPRISSQNTIHA